ncbi:MAG: hypothetical protein IMY72_08365 [Bacteroidetes bacterium]|nr:hypothetical protein [Bacteroidota bacterium]
MKKTLFLAIGIFLLSNLFSQTNKKENLQAVDGEKILQKITKFQLSSWNYEGEKNIRYYTPFAKKFFSSFGNDGIGIIGNDSIIDAINFASVNFIAIKTLEQRTKKLKSTQDELQETQLRLQQESSKIMNLQMQIDKLKSSLDDINIFRSKIINMEDRIQETNRKIEELEK